MTGLRLMSRMAQTRSRCASWRRPMHAAPGADQRRGRRQIHVAAAPSVQAAVADAEAELGDTGRILLRPSGTEQMVRVMVEAPDEDTAKQAALRVASCVTEHQ